MFPTDLGGFKPGFAELAGAQHLCSGRTLTPPAPHASPAQWPEPSDGTKPDAEACRGGWPGVSVLAAPSRSRPALPPLGSRGEGRTWQPPWRAEFEAPARFSSCLPFRGVFLAPPPRNMSNASRLQLSGLCFLLQILTIILFAVFVRYSPESGSSLCSQQLNCSWRNQDPGSQHPRFWDVHLQALLGFGLLMSFLSRYGPGSVAINILVVAFAIQWAVLIQGFFFFFLNGKIYVGAQSMVSADFCTAAVLISTGAVLGRVNPVQMLLLTLLGVVLFTLNEYVLLSLMGVSDSGGSLTIHTFGAYFGLIVSRILYQPHMEKRKEQQDTGHQPDFFAVVGTIYLWIFWPSFTSATMVRDNAEPWAVLNTYFSLAASTLATFVLWPILHEEGTLRVVQIQDATLAGAVIMGMAGEMLVTPFGALIAGFLAGVIPPLGFKFLTPTLRSRLKIQDTCGVHNVHGLPGIVGTLLGTLLTALATADAYGDRLELVFPLVAQGSRTPTDQALSQLCALPVTLLLAMLGGCLTGGVLKMKGLRSPPDKPYLEKEVLCEVAEEGCDRGASRKQPATSTLV
ncbi:LOW QUALITY PROTEIN: ammonium transporter Rh type B-like [Opisthocomus hoazin]|uniref:LOW QUALITY PROTEIN: ammonium transporter Rh type B-like n=1 Tax=Opisthocomus hoazin TaxID=30419 RepID=UPI003F53D4CB